MAHSCPECDQACYCGGDIDDVLLEDGEDACTHCADGDGDDSDEDYLDPPCIDDPVYACPDCEHPNQFGELCFTCATDRGEQPYA